MKLTETRLESLATTEGYPREALWWSGQSLWSTSELVVDGDAVTKVFGQA